MVCEAERAKAVREAREEKQLSTERASTAQQAAAAAHLKKLGHRRCMGDLRKRRRDEIGNAEFKARATADRKSQQAAKKLKDAGAAAPL